MKHILFPCLIALVATFAQAQNDQYLGAMQSAISQLDTVRSAAQLQESANTFARIAAAKPDEWLPAYYAALANVRAGMTLMDAATVKAVKMLDAAQEYLDKAAALAPAESEVAVLQAFILMGRVTENPMVKGQELSPKVFAELGKASTLNPENPRAYLLRGMYTLNMPEFYGGGKANAKPFFEKAATLFAQENKAERGLLPHWGHATNARYMAQMSAAGK